MLFRGIAAMPIMAGPLTGWPLGAVHRIENGEDPEAVRAEMIAACEAERDTAASDTTKSMASAEIERVKSLVAPSSK